MHALDDSCSDLMRGSAYMGATVSDLAFATHAWSTCRSSKSAHYVGILNVSVYG